MIELRILGSLDLKDSGGAEILAPLSQPKRLALLVYLAVATPQGFHRRDSLLGVFWPDLDANHARGALRNALYFLRQHLGKQVLLSRGDEVGLDRKRLWTDAVAFERALGEKNLDRALELYRGDLLEGFYLTDAVEFEHWVEIERQRLRDRAIHAFRARAEKAERESNLLAAARCARRAVTLSRREEIHVRWLIALLARLGDPAEALREYELLESHMREEYGLEPAPETVELARSIRSGDVFTGSTENAGEGPAGSETRPSPLTSVPELSVAVLPFVNIGSSGDDYLAFGLSEDIIARLSGSTAIKVIAPASLRGYGSPLVRSVREIAEELQVSTVLEGSVRAAGDRIRITARLLDGRTLECLWAETYDRALTELLSIQGDITAEVLRVLRASLSASERDWIRERPTVNVKAWTHYVRGNEHANSAYTGTALRRAISEYQRAVEIDPGFARAHAQLSWAHSNLYWFQTDPHPTRLEHARRAAERALEARPGAPEGLLALGLHLYRASEYDAALEHLRRASSALPGDPDVEMALGYVQRRRGLLDEAARLHRRAMDLDPRGAVPVFNVAITELLRRRFEAASVLFERSASFAPRWGAPLLLSAHVPLGLAGDDAEARTRIREALGRAGASAVLADLARYESPSLYPLVVEVVIEGSARGADELNIDAFEGVTDFYFLVRGTMARMVGQSDAASAYLDAARATLHDRVRTRPRSSSLRARLGLVYAELGMVEDAITEGRKAVELLPASRDAFYGPIRLETLARIYAKLGRVEDALTTIDRLVNHEHWFTRSWFAAHPVYAEVRDQIEFVKVTRNGDKAS